MPVFSNKYGTFARELKLKKGKAHELTNWANMTHPQRLQVMRNIAERQGRDIRVARVAVKILKQAKVPPRAFQRQAAALLRWVQENIYFVNEPAERIQEPLYTLQARMGDCDDVAILLMALFESIKLPWRFVLSGRVDQDKVRFIEGSALPEWFPRARWSHVYGMVGTPPFQPTTWFFTEPTVRGVPLGWDVVSGDASYLPEMLTRKADTQTKLAVVPPAPVGFQPSPAPAIKNRSPAYDMAYSGTTDFGPLAGGVAAAELAEEPGLIEWGKVLSSVLTGVAVAVSTSLVLDWVNGRGLWEESAPKRLDKTIGNITRTSVFFPKTEDT